MAARGRRPTNPNPTGGSFVDRWAQAVLDVHEPDLVARRLTPVDASALEELADKVDRLLVMTETAPPAAGPPSAVRDALGAEVRVALADLSQQFQSALATVSHRLAEETTSLRGGLQLALEEAQRRQAQDRDTLRAAIQAVFDELLQRQGEDKAAMRAQLQVALADTRDQLRSDLQAIVQPLANQRVDSQQQLRAAFEGTLGDQRLRADLAELKESVHALEGLVTASREWTRHELQSNIEAALAGRDERVAILLAERSQAGPVQFRAAVEDVLRQQTQGWEARRAELEAALADGNDALQQALAEENARLRALEATLLGQATQTRMQFRADLEAALTAGRDVGVALVSQATERLVAVGEEIARSIAKASEEQSRELTEHMNDLQAAFEDLTSAIGLERRDLRAAVEAGLDTSDLIDRFDTMTASTAKGAADVTAAIDKLRRQPRTDSRVSDTLMALYEELERLRRKVPTKSELRLADDQLAAIVSAVKTARPRPAAPAAKKAAPAARKRTRRV